MRANNFAKRMIMLICAGVRSCGQCPIGFDSN
jgi:hypothetical protein